MWVEKTKEGNVKYRERYEDPMTGEVRKVSITLETDNRNNRKLAAQLLADKIQMLIDAAGRPQEKDYTLPEIKVNVLGLDFEAASSSSTVTVDATRDWKVSTEADWISVSPDSGKANEEQTVTLWVTNELGLGDDINFAEHPGLKGYPLCTEAKTEIKKATDEMVANGALRGMDRQKKKRRKHLKPTGARVEALRERMATGQSVQDHELRAWLREEEEKLVQV